MKIIIFLLILNASALYSQSIVDNEFAFGFDNVFEWNTVILEKPVGETHIRMIMFKEIATFKERMIMIDLQELKDKQFVSFLDSGLVVIDSLSNPYGRKATLIAISPQSSGRAHAVIDHFGYVLRVSLFDSNGIDMEKFRKLIASYVNMRFDF